MVRPTLPEGQKRSVHMKAMMRPAGAAKVRAKCRELGINESEAIRQGLALWMEKHTKG